MERLNGAICLVTGGTGFVGSHVVEELIKRGSRVIVTYRSLDPASYFTTVNLSSRVVLVQADLKDWKRVFDIVTKYEVEYIFHIAAQPIVTTAYSNPLETIKTNVLGTSHILEAARLYNKVRAIIVASSDKAYGKLNKTYVETDPLRGDHPYEVSKSAADLITTAYWKTYKLPVVITRFGNIYGPGDLNLNRIVPGIIKARVTGDSLTIRSDGSYLRDYVYVKDVVSAYMLLLTNFDSIVGEAFNISCDKAYSVLDLVGQAQKILHKKIKFHIANTAINEIKAQHLDYKKIHKLGWSPKYNLKLGLPQTYKWYYKNRKILFMRA